jgi:hypothetical protein
MAPRNALGSKPRTSQNAVRLNGLHCVVRTRWVKAASSRQHRRDDELVPTQQQQCQPHGKTLCRVSCYVLLDMLG